mgnify:CR=1 FL=1|jgi:hypothetical protein
MPYSKAIGLLSKSVSRPTFYKVILPNRFIGGATNEYLEYFCQAASIPEVRMEAVAVRGHTDNGVTRGQPTLMIWGKPLRIDVIENSDFSVHKDFKRWMNRQALNANTDTGSMKINYYDTVTGDIKLEKLELPEGGSLFGGDYRTVLTVTFVNAYIKALGDVRLASDATNQYTSFGAEFEYERYVTEYE